jgi:putative N6-adenine-specific DNA methylase
MPLFVTCAQGLEPLLAEELTEMGFTQISNGYRGVYVYDESMKAIYQINYCSRIAGRVLLPLIKFRCRDAKALYQAVSEIPWSRYISKGKTLAIDANVHHKLMRNSLYAAQVAKDAICDQLRHVKGYRPNIDTKSPDVQLNLFIHNNQAILSYDTSGQPLYKRGYRQDAGEAPIQESLAAALLRLAGYQGTEILIDPCCGSGTFLIEAPLIATKTPPGYLRKMWGFAGHPDFLSEEWLKIKNQADQGKKELPTHKSFGCEIDSDVARLCRANLRAAGFHDAVEIYRKDFAELDLPVEPTMLIVNPPHGKRLSNVDPLRSLYRRLGDFMKTKLHKPGRGFVFTGNLELSKEVGLAPKKRHVINNNGVDSRFLEFDVY